MRALLWATLTDKLRKRRRRNLSIVINTLNRAETLSQTLESLHQQTHPNFEVVVINGPSTDGTAALLQRYARNIKIGSCSKRNLGCSRNIGIDLAAGEIVVFLDDDAEPEPEWLYKLDTAFDTPEVGAAGGYVFDVPLGRIDWRLCTCTRAGEAITDTLPPASRYLRRGADPFLYLAGCNMSFRRDVLAAVGGFNELLAYGYDDVDICCQIIDEGWKIEVVEDALVHHHRAPNVIRDGSHIIRDIYPLLCTRLIFALQHIPEGVTRETAIAGAVAMAKAWRDEAATSLARGSFSQAEFNRFVERLDTAIRDGTESGLVPRQFRRISEPVQPWKRFRTGHARS